MATSPETQDTATVAWWKHTTIGPGARRQELWSLTVHPGPDASVQADPETTGRLLRQIALGDEVIDEHALVKVCANDGQ